MKAQHLPLLVVATFAAYASTGLAGEGEEGARPVESEPVLHIPAFDYPASALSSPEQNAAYAQSLATPGDGTIPLASNPAIVKMMRAHVEAQWEAMKSAVMTRYPVTLEPAKIAGVEVIRVKPVNGKPNGKILLNLHGGAFVVGWPSAALMESIPVAAESGIEVIAINYTMYPEGQHPAALQDLAKVYREILKSHEAAKVGIFGGSAGGVITLQSIPWFASEGLPTPGAIGALACGFRTGIGDSAIWNFSGGFSKPGTTLVATGGYFSDQPRTQWVVGTSEEKLEGYPPTLWLAGTRSPELSGAAVGHAAMLEAGVDSHLYVIEGGWHTSFSTAPEAPESQDAMRHIARWFDRQLD